MNLKQLIDEFERGEKDVYELMEKKQLGVLKYCLKLLGRDNVEDSEKVEIMRLLGCENDWGGNRSELIAKSLIKSLRAYLDSDEDELASWACQSLYNYTKEAGVLSTLEEYASASSVEMFVREAAVHSIEVGAYHGNMAKCKSALKRLSSVEGIGDSAAFSLAEINN